LFFILLFRRYAFIVAAIAATRYHDATLPLMILPFISFLRRLIFFITPPFFAIDDCHTLITVYCRIRLYDTLYCRRLMHADDESFYAAALPLLRDTLIRCCCHASPLRPDAMLPLPIDIISPLRHACAPLFFAAMPFDDCR